MRTEPFTATYHVLLIGIDRYPPGYNGLAGCVNDIDAIERLLLSPPGVGVPPEQIQITRLAAPCPGQPSASRLQAATLAPTKANLVGALKALAGPAVRPDDRVLIYYSGHGDEKRWAGSSVWHEAMVPHNDQIIEYLFDVEVNALINAIAARTSDLTIVLDCCHSAGATREAVDGPGNIRSLRSDEAPVAPPDLGDLGINGAAAPGRGVGAHLLQAHDPDYLVVVACQSDEKAGEGAHPPGDPVHGVFTHSLLSVMGRKDAEQRAQARWAEIWPALLARAAERNTQLNQRLQHPWIIGHSERRVFGGRWEKMDLGYRVARGPGGDYTIDAGTLLSVTEGAEIAVYGPEPRLFPAIGSPEDRPLGYLRVTRATRSDARAAPVGAPFALPEGARGRLVKPGDSARLRVALTSDDEALKAQLATSPLLDILPASTADAEVEVATQPDGGWIIGNDIEPTLAVVPPGYPAAVRAGLEHYYGYNAVLRLARNCNAPELSHSLSVRLLDCDDQAALAAMSQHELADPVLPEARRDHDRIYTMHDGGRFCVRVGNSSRYTLHVTLLSCTSAGLVQYLSDAELRPGSAHVMWLDNDLGQPFPAIPDAMPSPGPGAPLAPSVTDRLIAIGTTRKDADLRHLAVDKTVQQVVEECLNRGRGSLPKTTAAAPAELWTATVTPIRIARW